MDDHFILLNEAGWSTFPYTYFKLTKVDKLHLITINTLAV